MPIDEKELKRDLKVDCFNLKEEWETQPNLYSKWGIRLSRATEKLSLLKRKLAKRIISKGSISDAALTRKIDINKEVISLQRDVDDYKQAIGGVWQKKASLEHEQQLLIGGFFSEPKQKKERRSGHR